jgi:leader peptidase (prepilin peptidase)/N-methyltransferase
VVSLAASGALIGLVVGSFLNVVAYRVPLGRSVVHPRSACPVCGTEIHNRDNLPVVSWILLRGRCRQCGSAISARYPAVEAVTAALFAAVPLVIGIRWVVPAYWWFVAVCIVLFLTDLDHKRIPNRILFPGIAGGLVLLVAGSLPDGTGAGGGAGALVRAIAGGAAYFAFLLVLALVARGGLGYGDVKLAFLLGLFTAYRSWGSLVAGIMIAFLLGGLVALGLLAFRRVGRKQAIPFGPALITGALVAAAYGPEIADWYIGA